MYHNEYLEEADSRSRSFASLTADAVLRGDGLADLYASAYRDAETDIRDYWAMRDDLEAVAS